MSLMLVGEREAPSDAASTAPPPLTIIVQGQGNKLRINDLTRVEEQNCLMSA